MRIGHLGAYSIDNAGDVLVGLATRQALRALSPDLDISIYAPKAPHKFWAHDFTAQRGVDGPIAPIEPEASMAWADDLDALIIGGGGLLSSEPNFACFLLGDDYNGPPAAWNSVGSLGEAWYLDEFESIYARVRRCAEQLAYRSVRNQVSAKFLRQCGVTQDVSVVPDPAFLLETEPDTDRALLRDHDVDPDAFVIGVSVGYAVLDTRTRHFFSKIFAALEHFAKTDPAVQIVVFAFGNVYGDPEHQQHARQAMPSSRLIESSIAPVDLWRLIGSLDMYIGTRFHAVIAALAQDVPVLILDEYLDDAIASSKLRELAVDHSLEPHYLSPWISTKPEQKLRKTLEDARRGAISFASELARVRRQLASHYTALLTALAIPITGQLDVES